MSKFVDNLKKVCDGAPAPIGFLPRQTESVPCRMQLVAVVAPENLDRSAEFMEGIDAILLPVASENPSKKRLSGFTAGAGKTPWGGWIEGKNAAVADLVKAGCDFIVLSGATLLSVSIEEKTGKILEVEPAISDTLLRAANGLALDAVFVNDESMKGSSLTWQNLLQFQRIAALAGKPILAAIPTDISSEELKLIWEAGVVGAVIDTEDLTPEEFKKLQKTLKDTRFSPRGRRKEKIDAVVPRVAREPAVADHEEEEEE